MRPLWVCLTLLLSGFMTTNATANQPIRMATDPDLSPNGKGLVFAWRGDIWVVASTGGTVRPLTSTAARESRPKFSPDGKSVAFISDRSGSPQLYRVALPGGVAEQLTFHTEGCELEQWTASDEFLLGASRDHFWRRAERLFLAENTVRPRQRLLFDGYGSDGRLSADGQQLLFTREGVRWWRKGYRGSQASQIWLFEKRGGKFRQLVKQPSGARSPLWHPTDPQRFIYVGGQNGAFNLWERNLKSGEERQLTTFEDDLVLSPCISANGEVIVFRRGFDLYRLEPGKNQPPRKINVIHRADEGRSSMERRVLKKATDVAFSDDGLEVAFIAGGDVWVMDTVLREPKQITDTPEEERDPVFSPDGNQLLFASDSGGASDIWQATRADGKRYWWQNEKFPLKKLTDDVHREWNLQWSPDGKHVAFLKKRGDLWLMKPDGSESRRVIESWNAPDYDWSPDGKWLVYALSDDNFNRDVHVLPIDGSRPPFNLSLHPDNDGDPAWSPDGKMIAFTGRRVGMETDIYYVYLQKSEDEMGARDRKLKLALEKIGKARKGKPMGGAPPQKKSEQAPPGAAKPPQKAEQPKPGTPAETTTTAATKPPEKKLPEVKIDFEDIGLRVRRVSISDTTEAGLLWSPDSQRLGFAASLNGKRGIYTISPPEKLTPTLLTTTVGRSARWLAKGNQIVWLANDVPAAVSDKGQSASYAFSAYQKVDRARRFQVAFDMCWREMRDNFYDGRLNNRNWDEIRRKYQPMARAAEDEAMLVDVVNMMLGELNGSHLGFYSRRSSSQGDAWRETTAHLGVRFDAKYRGPGLRIKDVIRKGPADSQRSKLEAKEVILSIDGVEVDPAMNLTQVLNGRLDRELTLRVRKPGGEERQVLLRPTSFSRVRSLLYEQWIHDNQNQVAKLSGGKFGYVHIRGMNMTSFYRFERELYSIASGKDGLVIDVRENGGGSTTDHLLTVLTQPTHAITVPRGGGRGYPHDRRVYATWNKPIVVLCNQNSFSNAEIFSHAIKTLKRGKVVGVPTAGGVISTGGTSIMDIGFLRKPFRGWFVLGTGEDMELNGAVPHHVVWPMPGEIPAGRDRQLSKAVQVLKADVNAWKKRPQPKLIKASERES